MADRLTVSTVLGAAPLWFSRVRVFTFLIPRILVLCLRHTISQAVHSDQALLSECVMSPTTPWPILRMENQPSLHWVRVHVLQFLLELLLAPDVEVVKSSLPEMSFFRLRLGKLQAELAFQKKLAFFSEAP